MLLVVLLTAITSTRCTRNNGDIGPWFGTWRNYSITVDGHEKDGYGTDGYYFWKFQNRVIEITFPRKLVDHEMFMSIGLWEEQDKVLKLDFTNGTVQKLPAELNPFPDECTLDIIELNKSHITLRYIDAEGHTYMYYLEKWG